MVMNIISIQIDCTKFYVASKLFLESGLYYSNTKLVT